MSSHSDPSPDQYEARLRARSEKRRKERGPLPFDRVAYRKAAALLWQFDPRTLVLPPEASVETAPETAMAVLVTDCTARPGSADELRWQLRQEVRQATLASFQSADEALMYLEPNLAMFKDDSTAALAARMLRGHPTPLSRLDERMLGRLREAADWLGQVPGVTLPVDTREIDAALERRRLVGPLRALLRQTFEGRLVELDRLREHIGVLPQQTWRGKLSRAGRTAVEHFGPRHEEYPMVVHGPAGIGKSTLLAKTLVDHLDAESVDRMPFVYVDSERATVWLHEPLSLLAEMARQLATQYPAHAASFTELGARARVLSREQRSRAEEIEELRQEVSTRTLGRAASSGHHSAAIDDEARVTSELGHILQRAVGDGFPPPFVVAIDSFEEAQYRASPLLGRMWAMFSSLADAYPRTRVIVAGRAPVDHPSIPADDLPTIELGELDRIAAAQVLVWRGVNPTLAEAIVARIGGNPLSLQLAARVADAASSANENDDWILKVPPKRRLFFRAVDDMLIQGLLYDRLLGHITKPSVRQLAHPGLVLRRITPDLIRHVLAPACKVDVPDDDTALELFEELARELDLVEHAAPLELRHRPDVRRVMLRLLAAEKHPRVGTVEKAAIDFYARSDRPEDRAEEIYHRLRVGGDALKEVKTRWLPEAAGALAGAGDELPNRGARILSRLLQSAPEATSSDEDQFDWEQGAAAEVEDLLTQGFPHEAEAQLADGRPWRVGSPLHALEVEVLLALGKLDAARSAVTAALDAHEGEQCDDTKLELLLLSARAWASSGDLEAAEADLELAEREASRLGDLAELGVLLARARLLNTDAAGGSPVEAAQQALIERVESVEDSLLASRPALFRAIAAEVGARAPRILAQAISLVGLPLLSSPAAVGLARAVVRALDDPEVARVVAGLAERDPETWEGPKVREVAHLLEVAGSSGQLDEVAKHLLSAPDESGALTQGIAAAMEDVPGSSDA